MKCPMCESENKTSEVTSLGGVSTLLHCSPFFDDLRAYHIHDENIATFKYKCSNNHSWEKIIKHPCPAPNCEWNKGKTND